MTDTGHSPARLVTSLRLGLVPLAVLLVTVHHDDMPEGHRVPAWIATALLALGAIVLFALTRRELDRELRRWLEVAGLALDLSLSFAFVLLFAFQVGQPLRALFYAVVVEAALFFGIRGGLAVAVAIVPLLLAEELRSERFGNEFELEAVVTRTAVAVVIGAVVGQLAESLGSETARAEERAAEAERLRDELGRRVDVLEAANRCARALGSSLELEQAFGAFIRELRGLVPFERTAIVLAENGEARVMATAGRGEEEVFPPGSAAPITGTVLEDVLRGRLVIRDDLGDRRYVEEEALLELGLRCQLAAPLLLGARAIGMLAVVRAQPRSFTPDEVELVSLLGRLVATAVQNIRAYEAEHATVEEFQRLSELRADFVSLVSHELRSPMAAVIGAARTLQARWHDLAVEQREAFLALIADEASRLAALVGDVLDTSRIEAGTFSYVFDEVDLGGLVREVVTAAGVGQDTVAVRATVGDGLPAVRGDRARLRQVLTNLIDNAVKYSPAGEEVRVSVYVRGERVLVDVADRGPGIPPEQQELIFEKFGRARGDGHAKPGTGLGLFIARSIAEAHGGSLELRSNPGSGSTFVLSIPWGERRDETRGASPDTRVGSDPASAASSERAL